LTIPYRYFHYKFLYLKNKLKGLSEKESEEVSKESEIKTPENSPFVESLKGIYDKISNTFSGLFEKKTIDENKSSPIKTPTPEPTPNQESQSEPEPEPEKTPTQEPESMPMLKISVKETNKVLDTNIEKMRGTIKYKEEKLKELCNV
jgi:hypothetical protein